MGVPRTGAHALLLQHPGDLCGTQFFHSIKVENTLHQTGSLWVDGEYPIFHIVPQHGPPEYHPPLHLPGLSPFHPG